MKKTLIIKKYSSFQFYLLIGILLFQLIACQTNATTPIEPTATIVIPINTPTPNPTPPPSINQDYIKGIANETELIGISVATGQSHTLFDIPQQSWAFQVDGLPDGIVGLSYVPNLTVLQAGIFTWENGQVPQPFLLSPEEGYSYFSPVWSEDGTFLLYIRYGYVDTKPDVTLMRYDIETEVHTEIAKDGVWPRISRDSSKLVYIIVDPDTQDRGLIVSDADGSNPLELVPIGMYIDVDTPEFSTDGETIYFTASLAGRKVEPLSWFQLTQTAHAHADLDIPVEWMKVPVNGGEHTQLSKENKRIRYGELSPDGTILYFSVPDGIFSMPIEGGSFTQISPIELPIFTVE